MRNKNFDKLGLGSLICFILGLCLFVCWLAVPFFLLTMLIKLGIYIPYIIQIIYFFGHCGVTLYLIQKYISVKR